MALNSIIKDKKRRDLVAFYEKKRIKLKALLRNENISTNKLYIIQQKLTSLPKNSSKVRVKNRCVITGRSKSVHSFFKISRIKLRELALMGKLPGIKKASW